MLKKKNGNDELLFLFHFDVNGWFVESQQEFQEHKILLEMRKVGLTLDDKER